jgi:hypothetical protein
MQASDESSHQDVGVANAHGAPVQVPIDPRPIPEIRAEIIRDMDKLCDWLHKVQKLHLQITQMRQQRIEAEIAARWARMHEQDRVLLSSNDRV